MDLTKSLQEYFDDLISNSPSPGSVNVSALCGALATSLGMMACRLTSVNEDYNEIEDTIDEMKNNLTKFKQRFFELAEKDRQAFDLMIDAFKVAHNDTPDTGGVEMEHAAFETAEVPTELIKLCSEVLPVISEVMSKGTKNSISDTATATLLISAAAQGAYFNVLLACKSLPNRTIGEELIKRSEILLESVRAQSAIIVNSAMDELNS